MHEKTCSRLWQLPVALLLLVISTGAALAQGGVVTGKVSDEAGAPIPSVRMVIVGTTLESQTGPTGDFRITNVPSGRVVVRAALLGLKSIIDTVQLSAEGGTSPQQNFKLAESLVDHCRRSSSPVRRATRSVARRQPTLPRSTRRASPPHSRRSTPSPACCSRNCRVCRSAAALAKRARRRKSAFAVHRRSTFRTSR